MGPSEQRRREDSELHSLIEHSTTVDIPSCLSASGHASVARLSARVCLFDLSCCVRRDHCLDTIIPYAPSYSSSRTPSNADDPHTTSEKVNTFEDIHSRAACPCSVCSFSSPLAGAGSGRFRPPLCFSRLLINDGTLRRHRLLGFFCPVNSAEAQKAHSGQTFPFPALCHSSDPFF